METNIQKRTYIRVTYVAQTYNKPVVTAHSFKEMEAGLDEYFALGKDPKVRKIGFTPYDSKYPNEYEGYFEYEVDDFDGGLEIEQVSVYCVDFYPTTRYEEIEITKAACKQ